jgi:lysosomal acid phosphatase/prostatic aicd phosphatase
MQRGFGALFVILFCFAAAEIVQVQFVTRHCDRTPLTNAVIPNDKVNWQELLNIGPGQLTGLGMQQCHQLGTWLRERYLEPASQQHISQISTNFTGTQYYFSSSDFDRTLVSAWSISMGLFPNNGPRDALPNRFQPVPVRTKAQENDIIFLAPCPKLQQQWAQRQQNAQFIEMKNTYQPFIDQVKNWTGYSKVTFADFYTLSDLITIQHAHNQLHIPQVIEHFDEITALGDLTFYERLSPAVVGNLGGTPLLQQVLFNMRQFMDNKSQQKFIHFSGHDSTLQNVLSALQLNSQNKDLQELPRYGTALLFELHRSTEGEYSVQVHYKRGYNGTVKSYPLTSLDCKDVSCNFQSFESGLKSKVFASNWCKECEAWNVDICLTQSVQQSHVEQVIFWFTVGVLVLSSVALIAVVVGLKLRLRRTNSYATLS